MLKIIQFFRSFAHNKSNKMDWINLNSTEQLIEINEKSKDKTQIIFKHSTRCSVSIFAKRILTDEYSAEIKFPELSGLLMAVAICDNIAFDNCVTALLNSFPKSKLKETSLGIFNDKSKLDCLVKFLGKNVLKFPEESLLKENTLGFSDKSKVNGVLLEGINGGLAAASA